MNQLTLDVPLLRKVVEWAEAEAARTDQTRCEWDQGSYSVAAAVLGRTCGTCYCIAGYVTHVILGCGYDVDTEGVARRALGITAREAWDHGYGGGLFAARNSIEDVRRIAEGIALRAGEVL